MRSILSYAAKGRGIVRSGVITFLLLLPVAVWAQSSAAPNDDTPAKGAAVGTDKTYSAAGANGASSGSKPEQETKFIDGHPCIDPYEETRRSGPTADRLRTLHHERLWAVSKLEQQRSELNRLLSEPHQPPVPVPAISENDYNTRVNDIEDKIRHFEAQQSNSELPEGVKSEARAQLLDLTRQKARAAMELITYRSSQQQQSAYNDVVKREEVARSITAQTVPYLANIDEAISHLMITSDSEGYFRLWMGGGFLLLVLVLIVCFFVFGSRSGSMRDIFTNDRGLQFITLFSLVIAITMFGLLNILEGKELSALLGGLSGYILGRSNLGGPQREVA